MATDREIIIAKMLSLQRPVTEKNWLPYQHTLSDHKLNDSLIICTYMTINAKNLVWTA